MPQPVYPKVLDANGCPIDFQGIQKVRTYPMPTMVFAPLTANGNPFAGGAVRAIWATTAGTATITDLAGNVIPNFPIVAGRNDIAVSAINNAGGLGNIFGMY
jgi:hypothetical protein